jgi:hypothetical protein
MDWQEFTALSIVALTLGILVRRWFRLRRKPWGRKSSCCGTPPNRSPQGSILYHARKGERPKIIVRPP